MPADNRAEEIVYELAPRSQFRRSAARDRPRTYTEQHIAMLDQPVPREATSIRGAVCVEMDSGVGAATLIDARHHSWQGQMPFDTTAHPLTGFSSMFYARARARRHSDPERKARRRIKRRTFRGMTLTSLLALRPCSRLDVAYGCRG